MILNLIERQNYLFMLLLLLPDQVRDIDVTIAGFKNNLTILLTGPS